MKRRGAGGERGEEVGEEKKGNLNIDITNQLINLSRYTEPSEFPVLLCRITQYILESKNNRYSQRRES